MKPCFEKNELEKYLAGWTDEANCSVIEDHLAQCPQCEQTVTQLESETKTGLTRMVSLASSGIDHDGSNIAEGFDAGSQNRMKAALNSVRTWNGSVPQGNLIQHSDRSVSKPNIEANEAAMGPIGDFGQYEICELIGRGGMAEVYRARHKRLDRDVAIKLLRVPQSQIRESLDRIEREIRAVGRLKHPSIVSAVDAGEQDGVQFLATEFIDGLDLGKIARAISPMPVAEACEMIRQAALGFDHAHANGIIHRDIKPSNLMLEKNGVVKILDFGLVRLDECSGVPAELTSVGQLLGTLDYMAPEQADRADSVDHRSDIYSLGATLFRLLAGRAPYAATAWQSPLEKLRLLALDQPPRIRTLRPELPEDLAEIIDQALSRDPAQRPASAAHLAEKLAPFCLGANAAALITQAKRKAEENKEGQVSGSDGWASINSFRASPTGSILPQAPIKQIKASGSGSLGSGSFKRIRRWLIGLGFTAAAIAAGIVLVLETQKGKIVIETDSPSVRVNLVAEDGKSQGVRLVPGKNETRIYAGRYEIQIDDGTDSYTIDKNAFILHRGETVVAKVHVNEEAGTANVEWSANSHAYQEKRRSDSQPYITEPNVPVNSPSKRFAIYQTNDDAEFLPRVLETILADAPGCRMEVDSSKNRLVVYAPDEVHQQIQSAIAQLAEADSVKHKPASEGMGSGRLNAGMAGGGGPGGSGGDGIAEGGMGRSPGQQPAPLLTEPVFEGHGIAYWINRGEFEVDYNIREKAMEAVRALVGKHSIARDQTQAYLAAKSLPDLTKSDWYPALAMHAGLQKSHAESLLKEIQNGNLDSAKAAFAMLLQDAVYQRTQSDKPERPELIEAIDILNSREDFQNEKTLEQFVELLNIDKPVHPALLQKVLDTPWLGPLAVLKLTGLSSFGNDEIVQNAFLKVLNSRTLDENQLHAQLRNFNSFFSQMIVFHQHSEPVAVDPQFLSQTFAALDNRLMLLADSNEAGLYRLKENFDYAVNTRRGSSESLIGQFLNPGKWNLDQNGSLSDRGNNLLEIIATMQRLVRHADKPIMLQGKPAEGLAALAKATEPACIRMYEEISRNVPEDRKVWRIRLPSADEIVLDYSPDGRNIQGKNQTKSISLPAALKKDVGAAIVHEAATALIKSMETKFSESNPAQNE